MKKILILAMSCNQDLFLQQEQNIKQLYAKDILNGKYENIDFWIYTGSKDEKYHINKKAHKLYVPCDDTLKGTYEKTYKTFNLLDKVGIEYDYILRTNLSSYVNVELLNRMINENELDPQHVYCGAIYCAKNATGPYEYCFYGCGNALLLSKFWVDIIKTTHVNRYKTKNYVFNPDEPYYNIDDNTLGLVINSYALFNGLDMFDVWQCFKYQLPGEIPEDIQNYPIISFREYNEDNTREHEKEWSNMIHHIIMTHSPDIDIHDLICNDNDHCIHILDFEKGMRTLVTREFADKFLSMISLPKYIQKLQINNKRFNIIN